MQVRLITTIATIINVDPENTTEFATARTEIFGQYNEAVDRDEDQDQYINAVLALQSGACMLDTVVGTEVTHSFEEVK